MAANETLRVDLEINAKGAVVGAKQGDQAVKGFKSTVDQTTSSTERFGDSVNQNVDKSLDKAAKGGARQARTSLFNLMRIVQDAPFGFLGMANNIDPAAESLQRLSADAGGGKQALSEILGVMKGPAGMLALISVASALFLAFGDDIKKAFRGGVVSAEEFKSAIGDLLSVEFDFGAFTVSSLEEAETALAATEKLLAEADERLTLARLNAQFGGKELDESIQNRAVLLRQLREELTGAVEQYKLMGTVAGELGTAVGQDVEIDTKLEDEALDMIQNWTDTVESAGVQNLDFWLSEIIDDAAEATSKFEELKLKALELEMAIQESIEIDVDESGLEKILREDTEAAQTAADEWEEQNLRRVRNAQQTAEEIAAAKQAERDAYLASVEQMIAANDASIESGWDVVRAVVQQVISIIRAKLAEAIAKQYAASSWAGPAGLVVAAGSAATLSLIFNKLLSGLDGGGGGGGSTTTGRQSVFTDAGNVRGNNIIGGGFDSTRRNAATIGNLNSLPSGHPNRDLIMGLSRVEHAIKDQELRIRGTDLVSSHSATRATQRQMGAT